MTERPKRRSRALEALEAQNSATKPETDITDEELDLIGGLVLRLADVTDQK